jgi:ABC-type spermidine/putrescine transport system permease subunit II
VTTRASLRKFITYVGLLLGNFSVWWGFCTLPIYVVAFVLTHPARGGADLIVLPIEVPGIGLALAALGLTLAGGQKQESLPAVLGFVLNAIPMALALMP